MTSLEELYNIHNQSAMLLEEIKDKQVSCIEFDRLMAQQQKFARDLAYLEISKSCNTLYEFYNCDF